MTISCARTCVPLDTVPGVGAGDRKTRQSSVPRVRGVAGAACTGGAALLFATVALCAGAPAQAQRFPITPEQRQTAEKVASNGVALSDLAPNAPSNYTIKRGDTLWSIATLFLKSAWRWPELWGMNQTQIRNPHLIYPGQTLYLVRNADGRAQLVMGGSPEATAPGTTPLPAAAPLPPPVPTVRLSPRARELGTDQGNAISSIPNNLIEPFLSKPLIVAPDAMAQYPRIVATQQDRVYLGAGDTAYARGVSDDKVDTYHVFRPSAPLYDPDDHERRHPIAFEALYLGTARVIERGDVTTLKIVESKQEVGVEDRLVPIGHQELISYVPRRTDKDIEGRIISVYDGEASVGTGSIVTLNRGSNDGLELGSVLSVLHNGDTIVDRTAPGKQVVKLPDESVGNLFVFRLFNNISYALLVTASGPIAVGDRFAPPDVKPTAAEAPAATVGPTSY
jgi:hypothetical protein